nr:V4 protein [French bean severe leaf curl virus]
MEYCSEFIFWWEAAVIVIVLGLLIYINGKSLILNRGIARDVRTFTGILHRLIPGPDDTEGPRRRTYGRSNSLHTTQTVLPPIPETEREMGHQSGPIQ